MDAIPVSFDSGLDAVLLGRPDVCADGLRGPAPQHHFDHGG